MPSLSFDGGSGLPSGSVTVPMMLGFFSSVLEVDDGAVVVAGAAVGWLVEVDVVFCVVVALVDVEVVGFVVVVLVDGCVVVVGFTLVDVEVAGFVVVVLVVDVVGFGVDGFADVVVGFVVVLVGFGLEGFADVVVGFVAVVAGEVVVGFGSGCGVSEISGNDADSPGFTVTDVSAPLYPSASTVTV